jgi:predicted RND superfamily exporter protein
MKKIMLFLVTLMLCFTIEEIAYAGNLNEQELAIVEAACEEYEYNGNSYRADQKYIDKLVDYLSQDNIDITASDKDLLIQIAYANIELGIKDGYLKPIDNLNKQDEHDNSETNAADTIKEALGTLGMDMADLQSHIPSLKDNANNLDKSKDTSYDNVAKQDAVKQEAAKQDVANQDVTKQNGTNQDDPNISISQASDGRDSGNDINTDKIIDSINTSEPANDTAATITNPNQTTDIENSTQNTDTETNTNNTNSNTDSIRNNTNTNNTNTATDSTIINKDNISSINLEKVLLITIGLLVIILLVIFIIEKNKYSYQAHKASNYYKKKSS